MYISICVIFFLLALYILLRENTSVMTKVVSTMSLPMPKYGARENFQDSAATTNMLPIGGGDSPALDAPRVPYNLLNDAIAPLQLGEKHELMNSQSCYENDYKAQTSLLGNYSQRTNNVMTTYPDTCTGPRQEFMLGFYKKPQIAYAA